MTEPLDTSALQQPVSQKEKDVDPSATDTDSLITNSSRSWSTDLPSLVVEKIYLLLNRRDQCQMSMVCKNWAKEYKSPSIWRYFTFVIPSKPYSSYLCSEVRLAQTFGEMFQHVKILCENPSSYENKTTSDQLLLFIEALTGRSQLLSFHIQINFFKLELEQEIYENFFRSFLRFIQLQNNMEIIEFINTYIEQSKIVQIFEKIIIKKPATLKKLYLTGIIEFPNDTPPDFSQNARGFYDMLLNVELLFINYSRIFERIIVCLKDAIECDKLPLRQKPIYIHLNSNGFALYPNGFSELAVTEDLYQGIEPISWEILSKHWPTLKVGLYYQVSEFWMSPSIEKLIVKNMPLRYFECDLRLKENSQINDVFRHLTLTEVCNFLKDIKISSIETINFVQDLITLLLHCPNLEEFTTNVPLRVKSLDFLFDFVAANRIKNLKFFCIRILGTISKEVLPLYRGVIEKYSNKMQEMGFKITCKYCNGMEICIQNLMNVKLLSL